MAFSVELIRTSCLGFPLLQSARAAALCDAARNACDRRISRDVAEIRTAEDGTHQGLQGPALAHRWICKGHDKRPLLQSRGLGREPSWVSVPKTTAQLRVKMRLAIGLAVGGGFHQQHRKGVLEETRVVGSSS